MALSAAAMFAGAGLLGLVEGIIPGGTTFSIAPALIALCLAAAVGLAGPRAPRAVLALIGPLGAAMIASTLATTEGPGDGAALYIWPVVWSSFFFGRRGALTVVGSIAVFHAAAMIARPAATGSIDRWLDVMVSVSIAAGLVGWLSTRNSELVDDLAAEARIDSLTGLLNRRGFFERAEVEVRRARRELIPLAVVSFDVDHFKRVNDEFGHGAGDRVLATLGELFRSRTRDVDVIGRLGGEEFVAVLSGADELRAMTYARDVRAALSESGRDGVTQVTLSAGIAVVAGDERAEVSELLNRADASLYAAKAAGRDRIALASELGESGVSAVPRPAEASPEPAVREAARTGSESLLRPRG